MQTTIGEVITKIDCIDNILVRMEDDQPVDKYMSYIQTMLEEYRDLLSNTKICI